MKNRLLFLLLVCGVSLCAVPPLKNPAWLASATKAAGGFTANTAYFDATDRIFFDSTGIASGKLGIMSFWINLDAASDGSQLNLWYSSLNGYTLFQRLSDGTLRFRIYGTGHYALDITTTGTITSASGWVNVLASWNMGTATYQVYFNSVDAVPTGTCLDENLIYADGNTWWNADRTWSGCLCECYCNYTESIDLSVAGNRAKWISGGKPVSLGADGSAPTGTQPRVYLKDSGNSWTNNYGTGGNFSPESGPLTTCVAP